MNEIDYGRRNEWDGLWTERNLKNMNKNCGLRKWDEIWTIKCGLKERRWNMNNEVKTEGNEI